MPISRRQGHVKPISTLSLMCHFRVVSYKCPPGGSQQIITEIKLYHIIESLKQQNNMTTFKISL